MDVASKIRDQYLPKRAHEIALSRATDILSTQIEKAERMAAGLKEALVKVAHDLAQAGSAAATLRELAQGVEIELSDESLGDTLARLTEQTTTAVFRGLGFSVEKGPSAAPGSNGSPATPPMHGTRSDRPRAIVAPRAAPEPAAPPEPPPAAPASPVEAPKRLVRAPGGPISTVTPRAKEALARAAKGAKDGQGVTHRADALQGEDGRTIPVDEQITVDDMPPEPGSGGDAEDKGGVKTHEAPPED